MKIEITKRDVKAAVVGGVVGWVAGPWAGAAVGLAWVVPVIGGAIFVLWMLSLVFGDGWDFF